MNPNPPESSTPDPTPRRRTFLRTSSSSSVRTLQASLSSGLVSGDGCRPSGLWPHSSSDFCPLTMAWGRTAAEDRRGLSGPTAAQEEEEETVSDWSGFVRVSDHVLGIFGINQDNIIPNTEDSGVFLMPFVTVLHAANSLQQQRRRQSVSTLQLPAPPSIQTLHVSGEPDVSDQESADLNLSGGSNRDINVIICRPTGPRCCQDTGMRQHEAAAGNTKRLFPTFCSFHLMSEQVSR